MRSLVPEPQVPRRPRSIAGGTLVVLSLLLLSGAMVALPTAAGAPAAAAGSGSVATARAVAPLNATSEGWYHFTLHGSSPLMRDAPAIAYDAKDGYALLFGGCAKKPCPLGDTWRYVSGAWTNVTPNLAIAPTARAGASMVYDAHDGYVLLFGGTGVAGVLADSWAFQFGQWTQLSTSSAPAPRSFAAAAYDATDGEVVLFGGSNSAGAPLSDTWTFSGGVWTNRTATVGASPAARFSAGLSYDALDREAVLFGGSGLCGSFCGDTWTFSANHWTNQSTSLAVAPSPRTMPIVGYDDGRSAMVLFGGQTTVALGDTWTFSHGQWTLLGINTTDSPGTRADGASVFDAADGYLLLFGGHTTAYLKTGTWGFLTPLASLVEPQYNQVVPGQADVFVATSSGGLGGATYSWNFGDGTPLATGPIAGHTFQAVGTYLVTLTATDQLAATSSAAATVTVSIPPLTVAIVASPPAPHAGQTVTITATAAGGTAPYSYQWSGDLSACAGASTAVLSCSLAAPGTLSLSITVTDLSGRSTSRTVAVSLSPSTGGLTSTGNAPPAPSGAPGLSPSFATVYFLGVIGLASVVGLLTYRAGRRREAARKAAARPLCYAVPAWSETPAEFDGGSPPSGPH